MVERKSLQIHTTTGGWEAKHKQELPFESSVTPQTVEEKVLRKALLSLSRLFQNAYYPPLLAPSAVILGHIVLKGKRSRKQELYHFHPFPSLLLI